MCDLRGLSRYEVNQRNFEFIRNATEEEREEYGWCNNTRGVYKCRKCGKLHYFRKTHFKIHLKVCDNECNGIRCGNNRGGRTVIYGYNDLATTNPELIKYFPNPEDAKKYMARSCQKIQLKCPKCGRIKWMMLSNLFHGFSCNQCSDGISYPEKIMASILSELNIEYQKQFMFEDFNYMYDFYLPEYNTIIEVHGEQHYEGHRDSRWKTYEKEHENDLYKYDLSVLNGYEYNKNFFIIDAQKSNIEYLKNSIEQCQFFTQFNLTNIDWKKKDMEAQKSLKIEVCEYWNEYKNEDITIRDLVEIFGISKSTIRNYLKWGNKNNLCIYDAKEEKIKKCNRQSIFVFLIKENEEKWFDEPLSICELSRRTGISKIAIRRSLHNKKPLNKRNVKYDPKYIGSMVVFAESTE